MFTKKYKPSVKTNNEIKENFVKELNATIYKLEKGRFDDSLDSETISDIAKQLREALSALDSAICTGEENIWFIAEEAKRLLKIFKKQTEQELTNRVEGTTDDLIYTINLWKDVLGGNVSLNSEEEIKKAKVPRARRKLNERLAELEEIKECFVANDRRLDKEIASQEKDLAEYEAQMLAEDNERKINDLYRKIKAIKSKIDMLSVRRSNYSACYNLLDMIYANAKEILNATDFAAEEIAKAKVLLNIGKLKKVVSEPDKAIAILKIMDKEVKAIAARTATMDEKVFDFDQGNATVNEDALKYKEELMRKKREKEGLNEEINGTPSNQTDKTKITEDN